MNAAVRRDGDIHRRVHFSERQGDIVAAAAAEGTRQQGKYGAGPPPEVASVDLQQARSWERTSISTRHLLNPDVVFKCVDVETAVVVGSTVDERKTLSGAGPREAPVSAVTVDDMGAGGAPDKSGKTHGVQDELFPVTSSLHAEEMKQEQDPESKFFVRSCETSESAEQAGARGAESSSDPAMITNDNTERCGGIGGLSRRLSSTAFSPRGQEGVTRQPPPLPSEAGGARTSSQASDTDAIRPLVCVPLVGAGDSSCIGMIGVQGFSTGALVGDDDWWEWLTQRMEPFNKGENRNVKRIKLVRPRGLPDKGRLEDVPTGVAAKVVCGSVERISRKRGMPVYSVR